MKDFGIFGLFYGHLAYFVAIWSILRPFGLFCGHLIYFMVIWYIFPVMEKSGKPGLHMCVCFL
jgi:hypothetical protein